MRRINFGRIKPSFLIIGVQKGGTTSLHNYLIQHPQLIAPDKKELHFFDSLDLLNNTKYLNFFPKEYLTNTISFESTPRYIYYPGVAKKIAKFNSKMKFIVVLRDPIKRAFSAWNMYQQLKELPQLKKYFKELENKSPNERLYTCFYKNKFPTFDEWTSYELNSKFDKTMIEPSIIRRGYYKEQIELYLNYFPKEQFFFIDSESLKYKTLSVLNSASEFLGINTFNNLELDLERSHERNYTERLSDETYNYLLNHFQLKNKGLEKLVNLKLSWM